MLATSRSKITGMVIAALFILGIPAPGRGDPVWWGSGIGLFENNKVHITRLAVKPGVVHMQIGTQRSDGAWLSLPWWFGVTITEDTRDFADGILDLAKIAVAEKKPVRVLVEPADLGTGTGWVELKGIEVFP